MLGIFRGTYLNIYFIRVFVEHFNKINIMLHYGALFNGWGEVKSA